MSQVFMFVKDHQPVLFNILFFLYITFFQTPILSVARWVIRDEMEFVSFGVVIFGLIFLETIAIIVKFESIRGTKMSSLGKKEISTILSFLWLFRVVIIILLAMWAIQSFGINLAEEESSPWMIVMPILVIKELIVLGFMASLEDKRKEPVPNSAVILADVVLFVFLCIGYTVVWESLISFSGFEFNVEIILALIAIIPLVTILFFLLVFPLHLGFLSQELATLHKKGNATSDRRWLILSYVGVWVAAMWPIVSSFLK